LQLKPPTHNSQGEYQTKRNCRNNKRLYYLLGHPYDELRTSQRRQEQNQHLFPVDNAEPGAKRLDGH